MISRSVDNNDLAAVSKSLEYIKSLLLLLCLSKSTDMIRQVLKRNFNDALKLRVDACPGRSRPSPSPTKAIRTSKIYKSILAFHDCLPYWLDLETAFLGRVMRSVSQATSKIILARA